MSLYHVSPHVFGYTCFVRNVSLSLDKHSTKVIKCVFLKHSHLQTGYKCYSLSIRSIISLLMLLSLRTHLFCCPPLNILHLFNISFLYHPVIHWLFLFPLKLKLKVKMTLFHHLFSHTSVRHK